MASLLYGESSNLSTFAFTILMNSGHGRFKLSPMSFLVA
jgi:hypothetical protein